VDMVDMEVNYKLEISMSNLLNDELFYQVTVEDMEDGVDTVDTEVGEVIVVMVVSSNE
jgi:hypothetical protein